IKRKVTFGAKETTTMVFGTEDVEPEEESPVKVEVIRPLHWHFQYSEELQEVVLKKEESQIEFNLEQKREKIKKYTSEIERLKKEIEKIDFDLNSFNSTDETTLMSQKSDKDQKLQSSIKEKTRTEELVRGLEETKYRIENKLQKIKREEESRKSELGRILASSATRFDYQSNDAIVFGIKNEEIEDTFEEILLISQDYDTFRDFTSSVSMLPDKEYDVSVYLKKANVSSLHWHVDGITDSQKDALFDIIRERGGYIDYDSEALSVFAIQRTEAETLKSRIRAMRLGFSEFGQTDFKKSQLVGGPVTISVYFRKK
ncbi:hypothetical protein ACFL60_00835, partial [Candidatus Omnitrophota bacterium]